MILNQAKVLLLAVQSHSDHGYREVHLEHQIRLPDQQRNRIVQFDFDALLLGTHRQ